jgi:hypothetical protein
MIILSKTQKEEVERFLEGLAEAEGYVCNCEQCEELRQALRADEPKVCTREAPHMCRINGPCNGYPQET